MMGTLCGRHRDDLGLLGRDAEKLPRLQTPTPSGPSVCPRTIKFPISDANDMEGKPLNRSLHAAKASKQDEFYTQLSDIEKELRHYTAIFKGKTVLCNCDDPRVSNFLRFFLSNFEKLKLKKLITT
jgi:hypothetical protein